MSVFEELKARGFIYQSTHDQELVEHLKQPRVFYVGFDPTADSLHVGSLVPIMAMVNLQRAGHIPLALVGGGTARVGDPSGKTEARQMLDSDRIEANEAGVAAQLAKYASLDGEKGFLLNNKDWLMGIGYIDFLREIGTHFSINRMLTAESVKQRLETGLSFLEFNYMLLQAYDYYVLARDRKCSLQIGGQDQWGNIVAGGDLCRRMGIEQQTYGLTFPLITNSTGAKFGKSVSGNVWLDPKRTSPFDFYQFWRNSEDVDVARYLKLFTLLPLEEIDRLSNPEGNINRAKEILAYEVTCITHGRQEANRAFATAITKFGAADPKCSVQTSSQITNVSVTDNVDMPRLDVPATELAELNWVKLLVRAELAKSNGEARRLIKGRGARAGDGVIENGEEALSSQHFPDGKLILRAGKKRFKLITLT